jgi:hypothetical protein
MLKVCPRRFLTVLIVPTVMDVSKANADLNAITSFSHFKTDNFSKNDVIIVCGGTRGISKNETNVGLRCSRQFAVQTSNTNTVQSW